ncbi:hypothetical protein BHE90_017167, partial [Fusarium euwallaceae]
MTHHDQSLASEEAFRLNPSIRQEIIARELSCLVRDEYLEDIMQHREYMEHQTLPDTAFIDKQPEIQWSMRSSLMDFLVKVHATFELLPETLFLAVNLLDRYCSKR